MAFLSDMQTMLEADAALTLLIADRLWPNAKDDDNDAVPYVVWHDFATPRTHGFQNVVQVSKPRVQFSIYAKTFAECVAVADAIKAACTASSTMVIFEDERGNRDATTGLRRRDLDVRFIHAGS